MKLNPGIFMLDWTGGARPPRPKDLLALIWKLGRGSRDPPEYKCLNTEHDLTVNVIRQR